MNSLEDLGVVVYLRLVYAAAVLSLSLGCAKTSQWITQTSAPSTQEFCPLTKSSHQETDVPKADALALAESTHHVASVTQVSHDSARRNPDANLVHTANADFSATATVQAATDLPQQGIVPPEVPTADADRLQLDTVIASVYRAYPSLEAAIHQRGIALGEQISAEGAFDTKLKGGTENTPIGFYETFRNNIGFVRPLYQGGEVFAGYRIGRGSFEPWYKERETNGSGEFKGGILIPLAQNRDIDERRANLWVSQYERQLVESEIQAQLIDFVQRASIAYWEWVAAGESYFIADNILKLANERTERIRSQVESGLLDPPELTDNLRLVAEREAKLAQSSEKLQKAAIKLSLYHRDANGQPIIPAMSDLPGFPTPVEVSPEQMVFDSETALQQRPELTIFNLLQRQLDIEYQQACNQLQPAIDAVLTGSKDAGEPTSSKNDKGPFQLDASVFVEVPIQRRKARGKIQSIESKVAQINAKRRLAQDQIVVDVQSAYASLTTSYTQVEETRKAVTFAEELAERERRNHELGASDLLKVTLREQYAVESELKAIDALLDYFASQANYRAALAQDRLP